MEPIQTEQTTEQLPWRRPEVQRLEVTLDTQAPGGSGADGELGDLFDFAQ
jgi:hypothetical protein